MRRLCAGPAALGWLFALAAGAALWAGPGRAAAAGFPVTLRDALGNQVTVPSQPQRIISLAPAMTEILFALGLERRIVAVTEYCDYPVAAKSKPRVGGIINPSVERILAQQPDLVMAMRLNPKPVLSAVANAGVPTYAADPRSVEQVMETILAAGRLTGREGQAAALLRKLRARVHSVRERVAARRAPTVVLVYSQEPLWVAGAGTFAHYLIELAGGRNAAADVRGYKQYSLERLLAHDPDVVLLTTMAGGDEQAQLREFVNRPSLRNLSAVKRRRVYVLNADIVDRAGPRIVEGLEAIAARLHPDAFKRP